MFTRLTVPALEFKPYLIVIIILFHTGCSDEVIRSGLDDRQSDEIIAALLDSGVKASKVPGSKGRGTYDIKVPANQVQRAVAVLSRNGLPHRSHTGLRGFGNRDSLVPRPQRDVIAYYTALADELEGTLESTPGVLSCSVHIALSPASDVLNAGRIPTPSSASVLLRINPESFPLTETQVTRLVASSIAGLSPQSVGVVLINEEHGPLPPVTSRGHFPVRIAMGALLAASLVLNVLLYLRLRTTTDDESPSEEQS